MAEVTKKKTSKTGPVDASKVSVLFEQNCRFGDNQVLFGVRVPNTYEIAEMCDQIIEATKILEMITVSKRADGSLVVLRGNRRVLGAQRAMAMPDVPQEVKDNLRKTMALIYEGLSPEEELELVNDQGQKQFLRSELLNQIWKMAAKGYAASKLSVTFAQQLEAWSKNASGYAEARAITDEKQRNVKLRSLVRNSLDKYILVIPTLGQRVQKSFFLQTLREDGLLKEKDEQPEFLMKQSYVADFEKAKKEDEDAGKWSNTEGGPAFNKFLDDFIQKQKDGVRKLRSNDRMTVADINLQVGRCQSQGIKAAFKATLGQPQEMLPVLDAQYNLWERKTEAVQAKISAMPLNVQQLLTELFLGDTITDFSNYLDKLQSGFPAVEVKEPVNEAEPEPEVQG